MLQETYNKYIHMTSQVWQITCAYMLAMIGTAVLMLRKTKDRHIGDDAIGLMQDKERFDGSYHGRLHVEITLPSRRQ